MKVRINDLCPRLILPLFILCFSFLCQLGRLYPLSLQPAVARSTGKASGPGELALRDFLAEQTTFAAFDNQARPWFLGINLNSYLSASSAGSSGGERLEPTAAALIWWLIGSKNSALSPGEIEPLLAGLFLSGGKRETESHPAKLLSSSPATEAQANVEKQEAEKEKKEDKEQVLKPEFKNIREQVGVYAFLVWMWIVIAVLIYVLGEQEKEADRRHRLRL